MSAVHVPLLWVAIWPPAPQMKLANALVSLVIASMPVVPGYVCCSFTASASSSAQVVGVLVMPAFLNWSVRYHTARTPPNHGTAYVVPPWVSLASMPGTRPLVPDQLLRSLLSEARMPLAASVGVSVLPSSVMSGMFLPLDSALFQSVVRLLHGIQSTLTWVLAYCGNCLWNSATTLFIQVTWDATSPPIRQTVSVFGADDAVVELLELPELQPAMASAAAAAPATAPSAADLFLSPTAGTPSAKV